MKNSQLLKGVLEGCVLLLIEKREMYGYEIVQEMRTLGFTDIVAGTIYPLLQKLEKNTSLESYKKPSDDGPDRKYYKITDIGRHNILKFKNDWQTLGNIVNTFIHLEE